LVSKSVLEPPVIVRIVPWVGKVSDSYEGSWICGGVCGGKLASVLTWGLALFGIGLLRRLFGVLLHLPF
jgi:hypothetical protein